MTGKQEPLTDLHSLTDTDVDQRPRAPQNPNLLERHVTGFAPGTLITTLRGKIAIEALSKQDMILTRDHGFQPLRWRGSRRGDWGASPGTPDPHPIRIGANAFGQGQPERDLIVSPHHRILRRDPILLCRMAEQEALVEAQALTDHPFISRAEIELTSYLFLLLDCHEVILADSCWAETLLMSPDAQALLRNPPQGAEITQPPAHMPLHLREPARRCLGVDDVPILLRA